MTAYTKRIYEREFNILSAIKDLGITPKILDLTNNYVIMEKYDCTLLDYLYSINANETTLQIIKEKITTLINILHSNNIFHGDLHCDNIVINLTDQSNINKSNIDVKLIDFDMASTFGDITKDRLSRYNFLLEIKPPAKTIAKLVQYEKDLVNSFVFPKQQYY